MLRFSAVVAGSDIERIAGSNLTPNKRSSMTNWLRWLVPTPRRCATLVTRLLFAGQCCCWHGHDVGGG